MTTTELAALDTEAISSQAAAASGKWALILWIAIGSLAAIGTTLLVVKMRHARPAPRSALSPRRSAESTSDREPVFARTIAAAKNGGAESSRPVPAPAAANGNGKSAKTQKPTKTNGQSSSHRHRDFDYNRYFNDLMASVSGHLGYGNDGQGVTRIVAAPANGAQTAASAAVGGAQPLPSAMDVHSQMIANQRSLIEEQRRLIYEQTKLIEEKSKLIAEKNQLLDRQTDLLENKLL